MRVAYFGLPLGALLLDGDGHDLVYVGLCRRDVGLRRAEKRFGDRLAYKPDVRSPDLAARLRTLAPDLFVSWYWTSLLPMKLVQTARHGGINVHPSLLPRHRGADPTAWAILAGDTETGVTVHRLAARYDSGEIILQERLAIDTRWNAWKLAKALDRPSLRALRATVARFSRDEPVASIPQDEARATDAPALDDDACVVRWSQPTDLVLRQVRALAPHPGAFTVIGSTPVTLLRAEPAPRVPLVLEPGEGASLDGYAVVRTSDGAVRLLEGSIEGAPADAAALARLFVVAPG